MRPSLSCLAAAAAGCLAAAAAGCLAAAPPAAASGGAPPPDVFNGRIGYTSFSVDHDPGPGELFDGDIFTVPSWGGEPRQLTTDPAYDAQTDWSPDGTTIAYRIRKPGATVNFEVARMPAGGGERTVLTASPEGQASSMPSWFPDGSGIVFRVSGRGIDSDAWRMGPFGESPQPLFDLPGDQWYPSLSPDMQRIAFATTLSPMGDTDRGIFTAKSDGTDVEQVYDAPGVMDTAPAWSPDGRRIAFESESDPDGGNPEGDREIFVMDADGSGLVQLTRNADHDEGAAWSPDGTLLAYSGGPDPFHGDIHVMTADGKPVRTLTRFAGRDESPDWQPIPAPAADERCGDQAALGVHDVRAAGLPCHRALRLARRWARCGRPAHAKVTDFGGTLRVVLEKPGRHPGRDRLVAFLADRGG